METPQASTVRRTHRQRVAILELDYPGRTMNVVDERLLGDLQVEVEAALTDPQIDAIVLSSGKSSFGAGADVSWLPELGEREDAEAFLAGVHAFMTALVRAPKPLVAAINGAAFGGALELTLAARAIVATPDSRVGLPEVTLGLLPAGGGTQLLRRFVPLSTAVDLLVSGRHVKAEEAAALGLVSAVIPHSDLINEAVHLARSLSGEDPRSDGLLPATIQELAEYRSALASRRLPLSQAAEQILAVLAEGISGGLADGLAAERQGFLKLLRSPAARSAIHLFEVEAAVKRRSTDGGDKINRLAVIGGGQMGSGIAATAATRGLSAVVRDTSRASLDRARDYLDRVSSRVGKTEEASARWSSTSDWTGFADADAVVEAVFEDRSVKAEVLKSVSAEIPVTAILATNTSAMSIADLAADVERPERFLGMHFFSPVERMPLVELIAHPTTSAQTIARASVIARQLGKVPVTVGDAPGFLTSRVYARWLIEGVRLLLDGANPADIDAAAKSVGFAVGPMQAHDEATLELVLQASIGQVADKVMTSRLDVGGVRAALELLVRNGVRGRRHGLGFYNYEDGKRGVANQDVLTLLGIEPSNMRGDELGERLLLAFASECFLCWDDGILCHPDDGDLACVLGIGFPRTLGGPFHWADETGAHEVIARCRALGETEFPTGRTLARLATERNGFRDELRRPTPFDGQVGLSR
ncbi:3-hydroxyacyl-CoA dehydrogenase NAD-binding domain-containing protein [Rhodococcus koreensis]